MASVSALRVGVVGCGLLGGSLALALRRRAGVTDILGLAATSADADAALRAGVVERATAVPAALGDRQLIAVATPLGAFADVFGAVAQHAPDGAVVTDVCSVKRAPIALAQQLLPPRLRFVPGHPMAGSERSGPQHASADLFVGRPWILCPDRELAGEAGAMVEALAWAVGAWVTWMDAQAHDDAVAQVSHVPRLVAAALLLSADPAVLSVAGPGLVDATRTAGSDVRLWQEILSANADPVVAHLRRLITALRSLEATLAEPGDISPALAQARDRRAQLLAGPGPHIAPAPSPSSPAPSPQSPAPALGPSLPVLPGDLPRRP